MATVCHRHHRLPEEVAARSARAQVPWSRPLPHAGGGLEATRSTAAWRPSARAMLAAAAAAAAVIACVAFMAHGALASSVPLVVHLKPGHPQCYYLTLSSGSQLYLSYQVMSPDLTLSSVELKDKNGAMIWGNRTTTNGYFSQAMLASSVYTACLYNGDASDLELWFVFSEPMFNNVRNSIHGLSEADELLQKINNYTSVLVEVERIQQQIEASERAHTHKTRTVLSLAASRARIKMGLIFLCDACYIYMLRRLLYNPRYPRAAWAAIVGR